jgi:hypothetical protein
MIIKIGTKKVYFWGSNKSFDRRVSKRESDGTYWVKWYGKYVRVYQVDDCEGSTIGWKTVEAY